MTNQNYEEYLVFKDIEYSKNDYVSMLYLITYLNRHYPTQRRYFTAREENTNVVLLKKSNQGGIFRKIYTFEEIVDFINDSDICYIKKVVDNQIIQIYKNREWIDYHDGTGDLDSKITIAKMSMHMRIDDYYISAVDNYMSICIDGQNIIHQRLKPNDTQSRARLATVAIEAINGYNYTHDLEWNKIK